MRSDNSLLQIQELAKYFPGKGGIFSRIKKWVKAVDRVSLSLHKGTTLGLVGEGGCGKSTIARTVLRLIQPTYGSILFNNEDILGFTSSRLRLLRRKIQIVFRTRMSP